MFSDEQRKAWAALQIGPLYGDQTRDQTPPPIEPAAPVEQKPVRAQIKVEPSITQTAMQTPVLAPQIIATPLPQDWLALRELVAQCQLCALCQSRTQTVFASGQPGPALMIVGEAPGEEEDRTGEPFVGQAGKLLSNMLAQIGLVRQRDVVIVNSLKCRPPANRNPSEQELAACKPYLQQQIELVRPKVLLLTGKIAALAVLGSEATIANLRVQDHVYQLSDGTNIPVLVTYHTAYYLRRPAEKAKGWADLVALKQLLQTAA
jgi:uracil-DNA glycosylase